MWGKVVRQSCCLVFRMKSLKACKSMTHARTCSLIPMFHSTQVCTYHWSSVKEGSVFGCSQEEQVSASGRSARGRCGFGARCPIKKYCANRWGSIWMRMNPRFKANSLANVARQHWKSFPVDSLSKLGSHALRVIQKHHIDARYRLKPIA